MYEINSFYTLRNRAYNIIFNLAVEVMKNIDKMQCAVCSRILSLATYKKSKTFFGGINASVLHGHLDGQVSHSSTDSLDFIVLHCPANCGYYLVQDDVRERPVALNYDKTFVTKLIRNEGSENAIKLMEQLSNRSGSLYSVCYGLKSRMIGVLDNVKLIQVITYKGYKFHFYIASKKRWHLTGEWVRTVVNYERV